ncbi:heterokaryon incompatibility, partial [Halenospora varia]
IWINDRVLPITENLDIALENLRLRDAPRALWVDAICINQGALVEGSEQVLLMENISRKAERVLIWLGKGDDNIDLAFDVVESSVDKNGQPTSKWRNTITEQQMTGLRRIFSQRAWWKKIWIIQEAVFAREAEI